MNRWNARGGLVSVATVAIAFAVSACGTEVADDGSTPIAADAEPTSDGQGGVATDATDDKDAGGTLADAQPGADAAVAGDAAAEDAVATCSGEAPKCSPKSPYAHLVCTAGVWETVICKGADEVCDGGKCVAAACPPGQAYCEGEKARKCAADGLAFTEGEDCAASAKVCVGGACELESCKAGESKCVGNNLLTCNANGKGFSVITCASGKVCDSGACKQTVCFDGEAHCDKEKVIQCNAKRTAFVDGDDCAAKGELCCKGACAKKVCTPGEMKCDGDKTVTCNTCGVSWVAPTNCKDSGQICQDGKCIALVCTAGAKACDGNKVARTCTADGLKWVDLTCGADQFCFKGMCTKPVCALPTAWGPSMQVFQSWKIATAKNDACDLDGNGAKDNAFGSSIGPFATQINTGLTSQVQAGTGVFLLNAPKWTTDGSPFDIDVINGNVDTTKGGCSPANTSQTCDFRAYVSSYNLLSKDKSCPANTVMKAANVTNGKLTSLGAPGTPFKITLPLGTGADLELDFYKMRVEGDVTGTTKWQTTKSGKLCGAIRKEQLLAEIQKVPDWFFAQQGLAKGTVVALLNALLTADFDTTGDGKKDASSAALNFTTGPVNILGF